MKLDIHKHSMKLTDEIIEHYEGANDDRIGKLTVLHPKIKCKDVCINAT